MNLLTEFSLLLRQSAAKNNSPANVAEHSPIKKDRDAHVPSTIPVLDLPNSSGAPTVLEVKPGEPRAPISVNTPPPSTFATRRSSAFTMIEIAISLAVIGFALVAIIGILPTGMQVQKDNRQETIINQDATYLIEAIRGGARGLDDLTNYVDAPNRYGLPAFYELHVWAWEHNPNGSFADWNTQVSCDSQSPSR